MKTAKRRDLPTLFGEWQDWLEDFINTSPAGFLQKVGMNTPAVNIREEDSNYLIEVAAPGMEKGDFSVKVDRGVLTISSEKKAERETKDDKYHRKEFSYSAFSRSFTLPDDVEEDKVSAKYDKGVLTVTVARSQAVPPAASGRKIEIS